MYYNLVFSYNLILDHFIWNFWVSTLVYTVITSIHSMKLNQIKTLQKLYYNDKLYLPNKLNIYIYIVKYFKPKPSI